MACTIPAAPVTTPVVTSLDGEVGAVGMAAGGFAIVHVPEGYQLAGGVGQFHGYRQFHGLTEVDVGAMGAGWLGAGASGVAGLFVRPHVVRTETMQAALQVEGGLAWVGLLFPMSWRVPKGRMYAFTGTRWHPSSGFHVPLSVGYRLDITQRFSTTFEGGTSTLLMGYGYPLVLLGAGALVGLEIRFGTRSTNGGTDKVSRALQSLARVFAQ